MINLSNEFATGSPVRGTPPIWGFNSEAGLVALGSPEFVKVEPQPKFKFVDEIRPVPTLKRCQSGWRVLRFNYGKFRTYHVEVATSEGWVSVNSFDYWGNARNYFKAQIAACEEDAKR